MEIIRWKFWIRNTQIFNAMKKLEITDHLKRSMSSYIHANSNSKWPNPENIIPLQELKTIRLQ